MPRGAQPGERRGGRSAGTPNKRTAEVRERLDALGCDPLEGLAKIAADPTIDIALRARCYADLLPYVYPKRKTVELTADQQAPFILHITEAQARL